MLNEDFETKIMLEAAFAESLLVQETASDQAIKQLESSIAKEKYQ